MKQIRRMILAALALALLLCGAAFAERLAVQDYDGNQTNVQPGFDFDLSEHKRVIFDFGYAGEIYARIENRSGFMSEAYFSAQEGLRLADYIDGEGEYFLYVSDLEGNSFWFSDPEGNQLEYCSVFVRAGSEGGDFEDEDFEEDDYVPEEPQFDPVGDVRISLSPEAGDGVVLREENIYLEWYAEHAEGYEVWLSTAEGMDIIAPTYTDETEYGIPGGALEAGEYVFSVVAYGADGSVDDAEKWFRVESAVTPEPVNPVGDVYVSLSPEAGDGVVLQEEGIHLEWYAEHAEGYEVRLSTAEGMDIIAPTYTDETEYGIPGGVLEAGEYVLSVTAYGADGSVENAEKWFRVESGVTPEMPEPDMTEPDMSETDMPEPDMPEPAEVGMPELRVGPELYNDGMSVVAAEERIELSWAAENASGYEIMLLNEGGAALVPQTTMYEQGSYLEAGMLYEGVYLLRVRALAADGSASEMAEAWFRVESSVTPAPVTPEPVNPVGDVYVSLSPEAGDGVVLREENIYLEWYAEHAEGYEVRMSTAEGMDIIAPTFTDETEYGIPGGVLEAGEYVLSVTAYGADGSVENAEKWFHVESSVTPVPVTPEPVTPEPVTPEPVTPEPVTPEPVTPEPVTPEPVTPEPVTPEPVTPEPAALGMPELRIGPELYNDGMSVVAAEERIDLSWAAENATGYEIMLLNEGGAALVPQTMMYEPGSYLEAGTLYEGAYLLRVRALAADGSASEMAEAWFRVESSVTPAPVTPEPVTPEPVTPEPVTPEPVTPEPVTPEPVTPEPVTPEPVTPEPVTPEPVTPEPVTPEPAALGMPELRIGPELYNDGMSVVAAEERIDLSWAAENATGYEIMILHESGVEVVPMTALSEPGSYLEAGLLYEGAYLLRARALAADGSASEMAEAWFRVESGVTPAPVTPEPVTPEPVTPEPVTPEPVTPEPVTPEPAALGMPELRIGPELYNDGMSVVAAEERIDLSWAAENATGYEIMILHESGVEVVPMTALSEPGSYLEAGLLYEGVYLLRARALAADGAASEMAEAWFRVESGVTPAPVTPEPVTPEPVTPEPVTPEPVTPEPITPEPVSPVPEENWGQTEGEPGLSTGSGEAEGTVPPPSHILNAPAIYINHAEITGSTMVVSEGSAVGLSWICEEADYYIVELISQTTGETIYNQQMADTGITLSPDLLEVGSYRLRVHAGMMGDRNTVSSEAGIQVEAAVAREPLKIWISSEYSSENGVNVVSPDTSLSLGWNLSSEGMRLRVLDGASGQLIHENGAAGQYSVYFNAGVFEAGKRYTVELEMPERAETARLSFDVANREIPDLSGDVSMENVVISIEPIDHAGSYKTLTGTALLPLSVYTLPADAQVHVRMSANITPYPACSVRLVDYMSQRVIQFAENSTIQEWSTSMADLTPGMIYVLEVTPVGKNALPTYFLFSAEDEASLPTLENGLDLRFVGNPAAGMVSVDGEKREASIFDRVQNLALYWNSVGGASAYNVTLYQRLDTGRRTLYRDTVSGNSYLLDYSIAGMKANLIYELEVASEDGSCIESRYFYFIESAGKSNMVSSNSSKGSSSGKNKKPIATLSPIETSSPNSSSFESLSLLEEIDLFSSNSSLSPIDSFSAFEPIGLLEPLLPGSSAGSASAGDPSGLQLSMNEIPQRITQGTAEKLDGIISSGTALEAVQIRYQGSVIFEEKGIGIRNYNLGSYIVDTMQDRLWQGKTGEHILEVYVSCEEKPVAGATAVPALPMFELEPNMIFLPTLAPQDGGSGAASGQMRKLGDIRILIEEIAKASSGEGKGLQLTAYDLDSDGKRSTVRNIVPCESSIDFSWQPGSMYAGSNSIANSEINWDGWIQARQTDRVRFEVYATNGVRLTINGQTLINQWSAGPANSYTTGWMDVIAGEKYLISLDNFQHDDGGELRLYWEYGAQAGQREVVPGEYLYSSTSQLLTPEAIQEAVALYGLNASQEDVLNYVAMLAGDDRFSDAILNAMDAKLPIVFLVEGRGNTDQSFGGSLHAQGRMDAALVTIQNRAVAQYSDSASSLPDIPKAGITLGDGAVSLHYAGIESAGGMLPHLMLGEADLLRCVDMQCSLCGTVVSGTNVWHGCRSEEHGLEIVAADSWAVSEAEAKPNQGIVLGQQDFDRLASIVQSAGNALVVVDRKYMDDSRLDYQWLYDNVGLERLLK